MSPRMALWDHVCPSACLTQTPRVWGYLCLQEWRKPNSRGKCLRHCGLQPMSPCPCGCPKHMVCPWARAVFGRWLLAWAGWPCLQLDSGCTEGGKSALARQACISAPAFSYRWESRHFPSPKNYCNWPEFCLDFKFSVFLNEFWEALSCWVRRRSKAGILFPPKSPFCRHW